MSTVFDYYCETCFAPAVALHNGAWQCARCINEGRCLPTGDEIDRGWAEYNDHREQVGGKL